MKRLSIISQTFEKKKVPQIWLISSEEDFLRQEAESAFEKEAAKKIPEGEAYTFYADQIDEETLVNDLNTPSLLAPTSIYKIKNAEQLSMTVLESILKASEASQNYEDFMVLLTCKKLDKRKSEVKKLLKTALHIELKAPYDNQIQRWIEDLAKEKSVKIKRQAVEDLHYLVGDSLSELSDGLDQLKDLYPQTLIDSEMVQKSIGLKRQSDAFKICELLGYGDFTQASLDIDIALQSKQSSIGLVHLLNRHFHILYNIKTHAHLSKNDLAKKVGVPAFFLKQYQEQSRLWSQEKLDQALDLLTNADVLLKSAKLSEQSLMSKLLIHLTSIYSEIHGRRETWLESGPTLFQ